MWGQKRDNMTKQEKYTSLLPQVQAVMDEKADIIANMANMAAMLHETVGFWWTGFYRVIGDELMLGPFQGPLACTHIAYGRGVCGGAGNEGGVGGGHGTGDHAAPAGADEQGGLFFQGHRLEDVVDVVLAELRLRRRHDGAKKGTKNQGESFHMGVL